MKILEKSFMLWVPLAAAILGLSALSYVGTQQVYRQSLNDPQTQLAEDAAALLSKGVSAKSITPQSATDIKESLAPWIAVYDQKGTPVAYSGTLDGLPPAPPQGIFSAAMLSGSDRVSWQPQSGVREAIVVVPYRDGFVIAGRNMREVELREDDLLTIYGIGTMAILLISFLCVFFMETYAHERSLR